MSMIDRIKNAGEDTAGRLKETLGRATDDRELQIEGVAEQEDARSKEADAIKPKDR